MQSSVAGCDLLCANDYTDFLLFQSGHFSAPMLLPIAVAYIIHLGYGSLLANEDTRKKGLFCCSVDWLREHLKLEGWRNRKPIGTCCVYLICGAETSAGFELCLP